MYKSICVQQEPLNNENGEMSHRNQVGSKPQELQKKEKWGLFFLTQVATLIVFFLCKQYGYNLFHFFIEGYTIVVSISVYLIVINSRESFKHNFIQVLSIGYLFFALLHTVHTLAYKGMNIFSGYDSNLPTQLWIFSRYLQSVTFVIAIFLSDKKINIRITHVIYFLISGVGLFLMFARKFPDAFIEGVGLTPFKIYSEYLIIFIIFSSLYLLSKRKEQFDPYLLKFIYLSLVLSILAEFMFTLYSGPFDIFNFIGHYFMFISVVFIYKAVIQITVKYPQNIIFRELVLKKNDLENEVRDNVIKLQTTNRRYEALINSVQEQVYVFDTQYVLKECYFPESSVLDLKPEDITNKSIDDIGLPSPALGALKEALARTLRTGEPERTEYYIDLQEKRYWFDAQISVIQGEEYYEERVLCTVRDISSYIEMKEIIFNEKEQFKTTLLSVGDGVIATDRYGKIIMMNPIAENITEWTQEIAFNKPIKEIFHIINEIDKNERKDIVQKVLETRKIEEMINHSLLVTRTGREIPIEDSAAPIFDRNGQITGVVIVFNDCTERRQKQKQIEYLSFNDYLTGVYNRRYMEVATRRLDTEQNLPLTIMILDINGLKLTNDAFGHDKGDQLIITVADILLCACKSDGIVSRIGGDEFAVLLPNTNQQQAEIVKECITRAASNAQLESIILSLAIGYSVKCSKEINIQEVQKEADNNMYKEKIKSGRIMRSQTIETVLRNINNKYDSEQIHTEMVSQYCVALVKALGLGDNEMSQIKVIGVLHDIGKILIPPELLQKQDPLTENEFQIIKQHPQTGYQILKGVDEFAPYAEAVLFHHERWDGKGYPRGLKGEEIPLYARMVTIADAYEAMTANRGYKKRKNKEEAIEELKRCSGTQFDPQLAKEFIEKVLMCQEE